MLSVKSIAATRKLLSDFCTRGQIKQYLLEAGARAERILPIPVIGNMKSKDYHSTSSLLSLMFDTIYSDFEKAEADKILLNLLHILRNDSIDIFQAKDILKDDGITLEDVISVGTLKSTNNNFSDVVNKREQTTNADVIKRRVGILNLTMMFLLVMQVRIRILSLVLSLFR